MDGEAGARPSHRSAIVIVGPLPPPSGGMANQTRQLAQLLVGEGNEVRVVQVNAPYRPACISRVHGLRALFRLVPYIVQLDRAVRAADLVHVMANSGWAWHLFAAPATWIARRRKVPVLINYRGGNAEHFFARQFRLVKPTLSRAQVVAVPSEFLQEVFARYGVATRIVPNIVNLRAFRPAETMPARPHLLVTRNLEAIYDVATVIRAFDVVAKRHPDSTLTIAGSGPERGRLQALIDSLGLTGRARLAGRIDNADLPALYREATVAVNGSLVDNLPISLLEAMASGVPIVSTNVGGIPHLVDDGRTALLVPPADTEAMARAIARVIEDRELSQRLRAAGLEAAQRYSWPHVREHLLSAYREAAARASPSGCLQ